MIDLSSRAFRRHTCHVVSCVYHEADWPRWQVLAADLEAALFVWLSCLAAVAQLSTANIPRCRRQTCVCARATNSSISTFVTLVTAAAVALVL